MTDPRPDLPHPTATIEELGVTGLELQKEPIPRKRVIAWAFWDWAAQPYNTVILSFVFAPLYLQNSDLFGAAGQTDGDLSGQMGLIIAAGGFLIAILAPVLGQRNDASGNRKRWLGIWTALLIVSTGALFFVAPEPGYFFLGAILVATANLISEFANVNYYAMLTQVATPATVGRVSGLGWGFGYLGGIIMLGLVLASTYTPFFDENPTLVLRIVAIGCAVWTLVFCIPLFLSVPESKPAPGRERVGFLQSYVVLGGDITRIYRGARETFWFLVASAVYRDGLAGIFTFAGSIAAITFGFSATGVIIFGVVANVVAGISTILSGRLDDRIGPRRVILGALIGLVVVGALVFALRDLGDTVFWVGGLILAALVGPAQTASRSLLARLAPAGREGEIFGLYATTGRATSFFSPLLWGLFIALAAGQQAWGIVGILLILAIGLVLFLLVPVLSRNVSTSATGADNALTGLSAFLAIVLAPIGLIVGIIALLQVRRRGEYGQPLAVAAIVVSLVVIGFVVTLVTLQALGVINVLALLFP
jgi:UMF1 family MFS transporter